MRSPLVPVAGPLLALAACQAPNATGLEQAGSTFGFLCAKYDRNGDGAVEPAEYTRDREGFARLDADADGKLTAADFPDERFARELGIRDLPAELRERLGARYAARAVVLAYFRPESAPGEPVLTRAALEQGFARLDRDASGVLDAAEFAHATAALPWGGPGQAWEVLVAGVDAPLPAEPAPGEAAGEEARPAAPPDGLVARDELLRYHAEMSGPEGLLRGPPGVDPLAVGPGLAGDGPPVGTLAPDFELAPPQGGERTRLSGWRGKKPVALVFGSYT